MIETKFQSLLVKAAIDAGGHAFKMSNRFLVGVPDLFVVLPGQPGCIIECKRDDWPTLGSTRIRAEATPKQASNIAKLRKAGQIAGLCVMVEMGDGSCLILAQPGADPIDTTQHDALTHGYSKTRGEKWPIGWIVDRLNRHSAVYVHSSGRARPELPRKHL